MKLFIASQLVYIHANAPAVVKGSFNSLSSYEDLEDVKAFFKDKDVRKFRLSVSQTYDSIQANADWLERDSADVEQVSWDRRGGELCACRLAD